MRTFAAVAAAIAAAFAVVVLTPTVAAAQFPGEPKAPPARDLELPA